MRKYWYRVLYIQFSVYAHNIYIREFSSKWTKRRKKILDDDDEKWVKKLNFSLNQRWKIFLENTLLIALSCLLVIKKIWLQNDDFVSLKCQLLLFNLFHDFPPYSSLSSSSSINGFFLCCCSFFFPSISYSFTLSSSSSCLQILIHFTDRKNQHDNERRNEFLFFSPSLYSTIWVGAKCL